jgi:hypothetical protein
MERYTYRPLRPEPNSTRLLQVAPGANGSEIHCLIFDHTIQRDQVCSPYEALSYVWGDPKERRRIFLSDTSANGSPQGDISYLDITMNLYAALQRLRNPTFPRLLWADAVCIDQENMQERAAQVRSMATIYLFASRVVVWLGEETDNSAFALAVIERAAQDRRRSMSTNKLVHKLDASNFQTVTVEARKAILNLMNRAWFHRIWVSCPRNSVAAIAKVSGRFSRK